MKVRIFEGKSAQEVENNMNKFLTDKENSGWIIDYMEQSESMAYVNGKLERMITITCLLVEDVFESDECDHK